MFPQWSLDEIILVDNAVYSFGFQLDNGIPILSYIQGKDDSQLLYLKEYLMLIREKNIIKDLKKTFTTRQLSDVDLDSFVDFYAEEDIDDDNFDILDQMFPYANMMRGKAQSFNHSTLITRHKFSIDVGSHSNHTEEEIKSGPSSQESEEMIFRVKSNNVYTEQLIQNNEIDDLYNNLQRTSLRTSDIKPKKKKKPKHTLSTLTLSKQHKSWYQRPQDMFDDTKVTGPIQLDIFSNDNSTKEETNNSKKVHKRKTKKVRHRTMKQYNLGISCADVNRDLDNEGEQAEQINLFSKNSSGDLYSSDEDKIGAYVSSNSCPMLNKNLYVSTTGPKTSTFKAQKEEHFSKSAQLYNKRNSSPISNNSMREEFKTSEKDIGKRKYSTSSESSDGDLERGEDLTTPSSSKNQMSRLSSSETNQLDSKNSAVHIITPFEKVIEVKEGEECSPTYKRSNMRRDSLTEDLDGLKVFFTRTNNQKRDSAGLRKSDNE